MHRFRFRPNAWLGTIKFSAAGTFETSDRNLIKMLSEHRKVERLTKHLEAPAKVEKKVEAEIKSDDGEKPKKKTKKSKK